MSVASTTAWPRRRLQLRSVLSSTMSIGWVWVAATALIPYFLIGRGRGAGSIEVLGIARTTWLSFHVWSSITIGLLTIAHVVLNRRGLARSYRITAGMSHRDTGRRESGGWRSRGLTGVAALAVLLVAIGGSLAFAATDDRAGNADVVEASQDRITASDDGLGAGSGGQHRGGR